MRPARFWAISFAIAIAAGCASLAAAEEPEPKAVEIPLKEIWAFRMPGTRDVHQLEPEVYGESSKIVPVDEHERRLDSSLVLQTQLALTPPANSEEGRAAPRLGNAKRGFAVSGVGKEALIEAHRVLVKKEKPRRVFPADSDVSLIFFSHLSGTYVNLKSVRRLGNEVEIRYQFVPHYTSSMSAHFALIPVTGLSPGKTTVKIIQMPMDPSLVSPGNPDMFPEWEKLLICKPFAFEVSERP